MEINNQSDHDLLISLNTKMEMLLSGQQMYIDAWGKMLERLTKIEIEQSRNRTKIESIEEEIDDLRKKTSIADAINTAAAAVAGVIGFFFGNR